MNKIVRAFLILKAFVLVKFGRLLGRLLFRKHRKKALLIGIRHDDDPSTETLACPHQDVFLFRQLLISECCHAAFISA
jgi:hypothetical protein